VELLIALGIVTVIGVAGSAYKDAIVPPLAALQALFLAAKGVLFLAGVAVPWWLVLAPLWTLLVLIVVFWAIVGTILKVLFR